MRVIQVLLAEDNQGDVYLVEEALRAHQVAYKLRVLTDAAHAEEYLASMSDSSCPDVFLLDLNLPRGDGHEILNRFRGHPRCAGVPVIIITSSDAPKDRQRAESLGASAYFRKPSDLAEFLELGALVSRVVEKTAASQLPTRQGQTT